LLALDTPARLKERGPGGTLIELQLDADPQSVLSAVSSLAGVLRAEARESMLRVFSDRGGRIISPLIQIVEDAGLHVRNIGLTEPSLETLFVSLTGRKLD
jgi:ABC-2 type transport system ATP-binding protein